MKPKGKNRKAPDPSTISLGLEDILPWLLIGTGVLLLVLSAWGDLWLDEILSIQWARNAKTPLEVLTLYRHDNNHPLNTWWLMLMGEGQSSLHYRFLSLLSGILSLLLIWRISSILSPKAAWVPLFLATLSFPLILYFSEARGYAPAIMFLLLCFWLLLRSRDATKYLAYAIAFSFSAVLAMLSHATAMYAMAAMGIWYVVVAYEAPGNWRHKAQRIGSFFLVPGLASVAYYRYYLSSMEVAGGPEYSVPQVLTHLFCYSLGLPVSGPFAALAWLAVAALVLGLALIPATPIPRSKLLFLLLLVVLPSLSVALSGTGFLYFRYFLVLVPFAYLGAGMIAQWGFEHQNPLAKSAIFVVLGLLAAGQGIKIFEHLQIGRGSYLQALQFISEKSHENTTVSSDHDFRTGLVFIFHQSQHKDLQHVSYVPSWEKAATAPDWFITHNQDPFPQEIPTSLTIDNRNYNFEAMYSAGPISGFHWFLYSRSKNNNSTPPKPPIKPTQ